jgi:hypothetical protein
MENTNFPHFIATQTLLYGADSAYCGGGLEIFKHKIK